MSQPAGSNLLPARINVVMRILPVIAEAVFNPADGEVHDKSRMKEVVRRGVGMVDDDPIPERELLPRYIAALSWEFAGLFLIQIGAMSAHQQQTEGYSGDRR